MMSMTLDEIRERKLEVELQIIKALADFMKDTGVVVSDLSTNMVRVDSMSGQRKAIPQVKIEVEI